ncbi:MAG: GNAT family N-acetyltransferase [Candidatus Nanopelagicales bacterium]
MAVVIRGARLGDHPRIVEVVDAWWGGRRMSALLPSLFLEHFAGTSYVAETEDGGLAGFLVGFVSQDRPDEAYVHFVGVRPDVRGEQLGRRLHDTFAAAVAARGVRRVRCVTSTVNTASVAFHTSIGFVVEGQDAPVAADGVDDTAGHVRMVRELP